MPKENDLEGAQDQGGKHGGQKGMPNPNRVHPGAMIKASYVTSADRNSRATKRAQQVSRQDRGGDPPGEKV